MFADTTIYLSSPLDAKRIRAVIATRHERDVPTIEVGTGVVFELHDSLDPATQIDVLAALRGQVDLLIELIQARQTKIRHAGDWGGDAA